MMMELLCPFHFRHSIIHPNAYVNCDRSAYDVLLLSRYLAGISRLGYYSCTEFAKKREI